MTLYVGEQVRISTTAREYAVKGALGTPITEDNVTSVTITILNRDQTVRVDEAEMEWSDEESIWFYKWDTASGTPDVVAGSYYYKITVIGVDLKPSIEWGKIRLSRQPSIA